MRKLSEAKKIRPPKISGPAECQNRGLCGPSGIKKIKKEPEGS